MTLRKFIFVMAIVAISIVASALIARVTFCLLVLGAGLIVQVYTTPYVLGMHDILEVGSLLSLFMTLLSGLMFYAASGAKDTSGATQSMLILLCLVSIFSFLVP